MPNDRFQNVKELRAFGINTLGELLTFAKHAKQAKGKDECELKMSTITLRVVDDNPVKIILHDKTFYPMFGCVFEDDKCFVESTNPYIHDSMTFSLNTSLSEVAEGLVKFIIKWSNTEIDYPY